MKPLREEMYRQLKEEPEGEARKIKIEVDNPKVGLETMATKHNGKRRRAEKTMQRIKERVRQEPQAYNENAEYSGLQAQRQKIIMLLLKPKRERERSMTKLVGSRSNL